MTTLKGKPDTRTDATGTGTNADTGTDCICLELTKKKSPINPYSPHY